ncbi:hypothetical protein [Paenibacillus sp. URB8-2]
MFSMFILALLTYMKKK